MSNKEAESRPDKLPRARSFLSVNSIPKLRFVDKAGRVFALDVGRVSGEYILREVNGESATI